MEDLPDRMRALRKRAPGPGLSVEEIPVPTPGSREVLVRVEAASLCGTDLHIWAWDGWAQGRIDPPLTIGHEFAGTVVRVGDDVRDVEMGAYVSAESHITCGRCFQCRTGNAHMCPRTQILGVDRDGALADYVCVPEEVVWLNDRSALDPAIATLQEPFGNAVYATGEQDLAGRSVAVLGCGPVGVFTVAIAGASGAADVFAADPVELRRSLAETMGASATIDPAGVEDTASWIVARNGGFGVDVVFEMSGAPSAIADAFRMVRAGGRVILFGLPPEPVRLDVAETMIFKNLTVLALNGRRIFDSWYRTRWMLEGSVVDLRPLITSRLTSLDEADAAFERMRAGTECKVVFEF